MITDSFDKVHKKLRLDFQTEIGLWFAFAAASTAVADDLHAAGLAFVAEIGLVAVRFGYGHAQQIAELEVDGLALIAQSRSVRLIRLKLAALDHIGLAVLDKASSRADKGKGDVEFLALVTELFDPFVVTRTGSGVVLTVADDLLYLSGRKILADAHRADERRAHDAFMLERQGEQDRDTLVGTLLILTADVEKDILPAVAPIIWQTAAYSFWTLRQQEEHNVGTLTDNTPRFIAPPVRFFKKKVGGHTHAELFAALYLVATAPVLRQRIAEA